MIPTMITGLYCAWRTNTIWAAGIAFRTPHPLRGASLLTKIRRLVFICVRAGGGGLSGGAKTASAGGRGLGRLDGAHQLGQGFFGVAEEHHGFRSEHEVVVDSSEPG